MLHVLHGDASLRVGRRTGGTQYEVDLGTDCSQMHLKIWTGEGVGYSSLSAAPGSTRAARRAGSQTDSTVMTASRRPAAARDSGSMGERR